MTRALIPPSRQRGLRRQYYAKVKAEAKVRGWLWSSTRRPMERGVEFRLFRARAIFFGLSRRPMLGVGGGFPPLSFEQDHLFQWHECFDQVPLGLVVYSRKSCSYPRPRGTERPHRYSPHRCAKFLKVMCRQGPSQSSKAASRPACS